MKILRMTEYFPIDLKILHYTGAFDYDVYAYSLFLFKFLFVLFSAGIIVYTLVELVLYGKIRRYRSGKYLISFCVMAFVLVNAVFVKEIISKYFYSLAYKNSIDLKFDRSARGFLKSWEADKGFHRPLHELLRLARDVDDEKAKEILSALQVPGRSVGDPDFLLEIGNLCERKGMVAEAIGSFKAAHGLRPAPEISVDIARNYLANRDVVEARRWMKGIDPGRLPEGARREFDYLDALAELRHGSLRKAREIFEERISKEEIVDERVALLAAAIYRATGRMDRARQWVEKGWSVNPWNSDLYREMAELCILQGDRGKAARYFRKELYYDNRGARSFAVLRALEDGERRSDIDMRPDDSIRITLENAGNPVRVAKGERLVCRFEITGAGETGRMSIGVLEPFGFGIRTDGLRWEKGRDDAGRTVIRGEFVLEGKRGNEINLGKPWLVNIVYVDLENRLYSGKALPVDVTDSGAEEGRILFVVTEDHELMSALPHRESSKTGPPPDPTMRYKDMHVALIAKGILADEIARETGVRWSHFMDIGSSILRLQWLHDGGAQGDTRKLWPEMKSFMDGAIRAGHDLQLHIHAYNVPGNRLFRGLHDRRNDTVGFIDNIARIPNGRGTYGSWSENFPSLGNFLDVDSRSGSIFRGVRLLESEAREADPGYRVTFFRAGEYEFGFDRHSRRMSILAMKRNGILAGSNAYDGTLYRRDFRFHRPIGSNVYFTSNDDHREEADSLENVGILEMLPVPQKSRKDYIRPVDDWRDVKYNYDLCLSGGRVKSGVFVLMEMFHLHNVNTGREWDRLERDSGDWKRIASHFAGVKASCPKMEFVTASDAARIYLDSFSPDVVALRGVERKIREGEYDYEIRFLGKEIDVEPARPHWVSVKPPSYFVGRIKRLEIRDGSKVVLVKTSVGEYDDIVFRIDKKQGYRMRVLVN